MGIEVVGSGEGRSVTSLAVTLTADVEEFSYLVVMAIDAYGYPASATATSDSAGNSYSSLYLENEINGDGSVFVFASRVDNALTTGQSVTVEANQSWTDFQVVIVNLGVAPSGQSFATGTGGGGDAPSDASTTDSVAATGGSLVLGVGGYQTTNPSDSVTTAGLGNITTIPAPSGLQSVVFGYSSVSSDETVEFTITPDDSGFNAVLVMAFPGLGSTDVEPTSFVDDIFGTVAVSPGQIRPTSFDDARFGTTDVVLPQPPIGASGFIDERFGTVDIQAVSYITPTISPDDTFGVSQLIVGNLALYYGPPPTPLIADAPYSQVYNDSTPSPPTLVERIAGVETNAGGSRYRFVITDMLGNVKGEVQQASSKNITLLLDNMGTASFTVKTSNPMADYLLNNDCLCKCYRQPVQRIYAYRLLLVGDVVTDEEDTNDETGSITFTVTDPLNRFLYRLLGTGFTSNGEGIGFTSGTAVKPKNIADVFADMLNDINASDFGRAGVTLGIRGPNTPASFMSTIYFTELATQMALYVSTVDGVDFYFEPQEPYSYAHYPGQPGTNPYQTGGPPSTLPPQRIVKGTSVQDTIIAKLNIYAPMGNFLQVAGPPGIYSKGRPYAVFEYGTGKRNIQSYQRIRDKSKLTNRWWSLPDGFPSSNSNIDPVVKTQTTVVTSEGTVQSSINNRGGYEQVDSGDLGTGAAKLRQELVNAEGSATSVRSQQITFVPTIDCDEDWTIDYDMGDIVTARAYVAEANNGEGSWRFNGSMRLYGISGTIDDNEQEQIQLTTISPGAQ